MKVILVGCLQQLQEQCYSFLPSACAMFLFVETIVWLPPVPMFGIFNACTYVDALTLWLHTGAMWTPLIESALKVDSGGKSLATQENQTCATWAFPPLFLQNPPGTEKGAHRGGVWESRDVAEAGHCPSDQSCATRTDEDQVVVNVTPLYREYSLFPDLTAAPKVGDRIAYKVWCYCPFPNKFRGAFFVFVVVADKLTKDKKRIKILWTNWSFSSFFLFIN